MVNLRTRAQVYGIAAVMLIGVVGEAVVLFFVDDAVLRLRAGMFLLAVIAWPLYYAARRFPAGDAVLAEHPRGKRRRVRDAHTTRWHDDPRHPPPRRRRQMPSRVVILGNVT